MNMQPGKQRPQRSRIPLQFSRGALWRFAFITFVIVGLCISLKVLTWFAPRSENDEIIYWTLTRNLVETGEYSIRGTGVIEFLDLPRPMYDRPLFHHPPMTAILLSPFVRSDNARAAILVSWLGHALAIIGVAMACWSWRRRTWRGAEFLLWLPVLAVALDPLLSFCSRKLWPDSLVGGFAGLSFGLLCVGLARRSLPWTIVAGIALGLAGLSKLSGLCLLVAGLAFIVAQSGLSRSRRRRLALAFAVPAVLLVGPWLAVFFSEYGQLAPDWIRPTPELIATNEHIAREVSRPWHYYLSQTAMIAPVSLVILAGLARYRRILSSPRALATIGWMVLLWLTLMILFWRGHGMQMRYLTPAVPALYVLLIPLLTRSDPRRSVFPVLVLTAVAFGAVFSGFYLINPQFDEIKPVPQIVLDIWAGRPPGSE